MCKENEDDLKTMIRAAVQEALEAHGQRQGKILLSRKAIADRLGVDLSTLWRWDKQGYLRATRIGGKVYYSEAEVLRAERGELTLEK